MQIRPIPTGPLRPVAHAIHPQHPSLSHPPAPHGHQVPAVKVDWQSSEQEQQVDWACRQYSNKDLHHIAARPPAHHWEAPSAGYSRSPEIQASMPHHSAELQAKSAAYHRSPEHQSAMVNINYCPDLHTSMGGAMSPGHELNAPMAGAIRSPELHKATVGANSLLLGPTAGADRSSGPTSGVDRNAAIQGSAPHKSSNKMPPHGSATFQWLLPRLETAIEVRGRFKDAEDSPARAADIKELLSLKCFTVEAAVKGDGTDQSIQAVRELQELFFRIATWLDSFGKPHVSVAVARQRLWFGTHLQHAVWVLWDAAASAVGQQQPDLTLKKPLPAPIYSVDDYVEYWSSTHKEWTTTKVKRVHRCGSLFDLANRNNASLERIYPTTEERKQRQVISEWAVSTKYEVLKKLAPQEKCLPAKTPQEAPCFSSQSRNAPVSSPSLPSFPQADKGSPEPCEAPVRVWPRECLTSRPQEHVSSMQNLRDPTSRECGMADDPRGHVSSMQNLRTDRSPFGRVESGGRVSGGRGPAKKEAGTQHDRFSRSSGGSDPGSSRTKKYDAGGTRSKDGRFPLSYDHGSDGSSTRAGRSSIGSCSGTAWETSNGSINMTGRSSNGSVSRQAGRVAGKKSSRGSSSPPAPWSSPLDTVTFHPRPRRSSDGFDKSNLKSSVNRREIDSNEKKDSPLSEMKRIHKRMEDFLWQCGVDPHAPLAPEKTGQTSPKVGNDAGTTKDLSPTAPMHPSAVVEAAVEAAATAAAAAAKISSFYSPPGNRPTRSTPEVLKPCSTPCFERKAPSSGDLDAIDAQIKAMIGKGNRAVTDDQKENQNFSNVASTGGA